MICKRSYGCNTSRIVICEPCWSSSMLTIAGRQFIRGNRWSSTMFCPLASMMTAPWFLRISRWMTHMLMQWMVVSGANFRATNLLLGHESHVCFCFRPKVFVVAWLKQWAKWRPWDEISRGILTLRNDWVDHLAHNLVVRNTQVLVIINHRFTNHHF